MSEWGIPQPSTFGDAGGCFVGLLSGVGGIAIAVACMCILPAQDGEKAQQAQQPQSKVVEKTELTVKDTIPQDTDTLVLT